MYIKNILDLFSKKIYLIIFILSLLTITFLSSYYLTHYLINPSLRVESNQEEKTVYNEGSNYLSNETLITLITGENIDYSATLENIKKNFSLSDNLNLKSLTKFFADKEYLLSKWDETSLTYTKISEDNSSSFLPNTYYLGEEDGFISIFKTDANGVVISSEKRVYNEYKSIKALPKSDQDLIINNKFHFDNKDDALIKLSEMVS